MKIKSLNSLAFSPSDAAGGNDYVMSLKNPVTISAWRGESFKKIGTLTANDLRDEAK